MYSWRRREDGVILVSDLPTGPERAPMLSPDLRRGMDLVIERWGPTCDAAADKYSIPHGWLEAMVWRESGGNPRAFRQERTKEGLPILRNGRPLTGIGLTQITDPGLKGHHTDEELYDPALNIDIAARHLASLIERYGYDFPRDAAAYNAGSARPDPSNPWNLWQTAGHVSSEVSALNYYLSRAQTIHEHELVYLVDVACSQMIDLSELVDVLSPSRPDDVPTMPDPRPLEDTRPDLATLPRREEEA